MSGLAAVPCIFDVGPFQFATVTPTHAHGVVCWDGDLCFYTARQFMGTFPRTGWLVLGPIDKVLDPQRGYIVLADRGNGMVMPRWPERDLERGDEANGAVWSGIAIPLRWFAEAFAGFSLALATTGAVKKLSRFVRHRATPGRPACPNCSYDLTANVSGVCPECGTKVARVTA